MRTIGLLSIAFAALASTATAVPRYTASVPQIADSPVNPAKTEPSVDGAQNPKTTILQRINQDALSCRNEWSGCLDDLKALVDRAKQKYGSESTKHMGRNATMIVPANLNEMMRLKNRKDKSVGGWWSELGNIHWKAIGDGYHAKEATKDYGFGKAMARTIIGSGVDKYIVTDGEFKGAEVVYDKATGEIVKDWRMGTRNFSYVVDGVDHDEADVKTHQNNPEYKYVGILVETDPSDPDKYYIVNGQTGKRMTWREAEEFPTTLSNEWKDMGLACVPDDAKDVIVPDQCRDEANCDIDTSKLEALLKERVNMLEQFIARVEKGERLGEQDKSRYEGNAEKTLLELQRIDEQIKALNVSVGERKQLEEQTIAKVKSLLDKVAELESRLTGITKKSDDATCQCANPRPYAFNGKSSIPGWANCENCGRLVGVTLNGKIISNNPLTKGKEPRWVTWEEAKKISERFKKK